MVTVSGKRQYPNKRVGIKEVAERAGVAMSSVSRVLSDHPDVSDAMRERVLRAVDDLGYQPDILAQSLRRRMTMSVGFAASDISNPVLTEAVTGAERVLRASGYSMLVTDSESDRALDLSNIEALSQRRVDGLLLALSDERDPTVAAALSDLEMPFVLVDRDPPEGVEAPQVRFEHRSGMRDAAEHLWELGHRSVALISGGPRGPARERRLGIGEVFDRQGANLVEFSGPFTIEHGEAAVVSALAAPEPPTAIVAAANIYMRGALRELRRRELTLGTDVSFVGCDDVAVAEFHEPPIALVRRDPRRAGNVAARLLLSALTEEPAPEEDELTLPTEYVARPSVGPARS